MANCRGKSGGSTPDNASQLYAYAFVTDNGIYALTSHEVENSNEVENDTHWAYIRRVTLDDKNCSAKLDNNGNAEVSDEVKVTNNTSKVDKIMTAILSINNQGASVCVKKLIDFDP